MHSFCWSQVCRFALVALGTFALSTSAGSASDLPEEPRPYAIHVAIAPVVAEAVPAASTKIKATISVFDVETEAIVAGSKLYFHPGQEAEKTEASGPFEIHFEAGANPEATQATYRFELKREGRLLSRQLGEIALPVLPTHEVQPASSSSLDRE